MRTSNPVFNSPTFQQPTSYDQLATETEHQAAAKPATMTVSGTAWKTFYMVLIAIVTAAASWNVYMNNPSLILPTMIGSLIGGLVAGFVMIRAAKLASFIVPLFAFAEGLFLAAISVAIVEYSSLGETLGSQTEAFMVIGQAAGLTFSIAAVALLGYASGLLRLSNTAIKVISIATLGVMAYYLVAFIGNLAFGGGTIPNLGYSSSPIGIGFSVLVVILASFNLVMDFQFIHDGARRGMPKHFEWIGAFGILTTLVWLYIEILRLLLKLRR